MTSLSLANRTRRPRGQAVCMWPRSPQVKQRRAFGQAGRGSATFATGSPVWSLLRGPVDVVVESCLAADLVSLAIVVELVREFPDHCVAPKRVCCSTSNARCRASETEHGSNCWNMFWSCDRKPAIKRATNRSSES